MAGPATEDGAEPTAGDGAGPELKKARTASLMVSSLIPIPGDDLDALLWYGEELMLDIDALHGALVKLRSTAAGACALSTFKRIFTTLGPMTVFITNDTGAMRLGIESLGRAEHTLVLAVRGVAQLMGSKAFGPIALAQLTMASTKLAIDDLLRCACRAFASGRVPAAGSSTGPDAKCNLSLSTTISSSSSSSFSCLFRPRKKVLIDLTNSIDDLTAFDELSLNAVDMKRLLVEDAAKPGEDQLLDTFSAGAAEGRSVIDGRVPGNERHSFWLTSSVPDGVFIDSMEKEQHAFCYVCRRELVTKNYRMVPLDGFYGGGREHGVAMCSPCAKKYVNAQQTFEMVERYAGRNFVVLEPGVACMAMVEKSRGTYIYVGQRSDEYMAEWTRKQTKYIVPVSKAPRSKANPMQQFAEKRCALAKARNLGMLTLRETLDVMAPPVADENRAGAAAEEDKLFKPDALRLG